MIEIEGDSLISTELNKLGDIYRNGYPAINLYWDQQASKRNETIYGKWLSAQNSITFSSHALYRFLNSYSPFANMLKDIGPEEAIGEFILRLFGAFNAAVTQQGSLQTLYNVCSDFKKKHKPESNSAWLKIKMIRDSAFGHPTNFKTDRNKKPSYVTLGFLGDFVISIEDSEFKAWPEPKRRESLKISTKEATQLTNQFRTESATCLRECVVEFENLVDKQRRLFRT